MSTAYVPYQYLGSTLLICRYLMLEGATCPRQQYSLFDIHLNFSAQKQIERIAREGYGIYPVFDDANANGYQTLAQHRRQPEQKVFLYAEVNCADEKDVLINITCSKNGKLWLNGICLYIQANDYTASNYITAVLRRGSNVFLLEQYDPQEHHILSLQLLNAQEEKGDSLHALSQCAGTFTPDLPIYIGDGGYQPDAHTFRFMYLLNPFIYQQKFTVEMYDEREGFIRRRQARSGEVIEVDLDEMRDCCDDPLRNDRINSKVKRLDGSCFMQEIPLLLNHFESEPPKAYDALAAIADGLEKDLADHVNGFLQQFRSAIDRNDFMTQFWLMRNSWDLLEKIRSGSAHRQIFYTPGMRDVFLRSALDGKYIRMLAHLPDGYDPNRAYPCIVSLSISADDFFAYYLSQARLNEPCLFFNIYGRGVTAGSYVGEASTIEILDWIRRLYKIDENRLYLTGVSNGGYATWSMAQNHPDLAAAIYPLVGFPNMETLENVCNTPCYQMISPLDQVYSGREEVIRQHLGHYGNYTQVDFQDMIHNHFFTYLTHRGILNRMLEARRNPYPPRIWFRTQRNRYLQSFWLRLHGIAHGKHTADVRAEIADAQTIRLQLRNVTGVTVTIPPQIDRKSFTVMINSMVFEFRDYDARQIVFVRARHWKVTQTQPVTDVRKGTGLLDIYLDRLRILLPDEMPAGTENAVRKVAERFASPSSNGFNPDIDVHYPICRESEAPPHIFDNNLLLLDICGGSKYVKGLSDSLYVHCDEEGFTYRGGRMQGDYMVMQVIACPYDPNRSILVVSANSAEMLQKPLFLRKVIIPTNSNGLHPYWNNEILVYTGGRYYAAYEGGEPLRLVDMAGAPERTPLELLAR